MPSSDTLFLIHLIRINGRQKTIMAGMLNALLPEGGQLPISMATLTGVAITKEGKALADCQITCLCLCFSCWPLLPPLFSSLLVVQRLRRSALSQYHAVVRIARCCRGVLYWAFFDRGAGFYLQEPFGCAERPFIAVVSL